MKTKDLSTKSSGKKPRVALILDTRTHDQLRELAQSDDRSTHSMARIIFHKGLNQHLQESNNVNSPST